MGNWIRTTVLLLFFFPMQGQETPVASYGRLLKTFVDARGNVDYTALKKEQAGLATYLDHLAAHPPSQGSSRADSLAYFINLYNAATLELITAHYPVRSIRDIPDAWERKFVQVGAQTYSLEAIEHEILRPMGEPRIHFAINCASRSCPPLYTKVFTPGAIDKQLDEVSRQFVHDPQYNHLDAKPPALSKLFEWYTEDFGGKEGVVNFVATYAPNKNLSAGNIRFLDYDWRLNEQP